MNIRTVTFLLLLASVCGVLFFFGVPHFLFRADERPVFDHTNETLPIVAEERAVPSPETETVVSETKPRAPKSWPDVPFIVQAPTGEWGKSEFQNDCEEASVLMAYAWQMGKTYTKEQARQALIALARYQEEQIGHGVDTDVHDTATLLLAHYFDQTAYRLAYDFTLDELKQTLSEGIVIVPTNGRLLKNPNFTRPGPLQHMLVITGYDEARGEFITNDPGTRKGAGYRYPEAILFAAIREYPTGDHQPIVTERKAMIVLSPPSISIVETGRK